MTSAPGKIITFYSYKGGTGRSMALANIAWVLATNQKRVLVIDWDLEAPGLHRYFHPLLKDPDLAQSRGIVDFFVEFAIAARVQGAGGEPLWHEAYANLRRYAQPLLWDFRNTSGPPIPADSLPQEHELLSAEPVGVLHFIPAGLQDRGYADRVATFDWNGFYRDLGGGVFLEAVKHRLRRDYDYVLIDSRTGLSDTSGICSVQMPDDLVCCFTLNDQSIFGASAVARSILEQRRRPSGKPGLRVWPVRTRVERSERDKLDQSRELARRRFEAFLMHLPPGRRDQYWGEAEVMYDPYFAYEEVLATFADRPLDANSILRSLCRVTKWITDGAVTAMGNMPEGRRLEVFRKFQREAIRKDRKIYVSFNRRTASLTRPVFDFLAKRFGAANICTSRDLLPVFGADSGGVHPVFVPETAVFQCDLLLVLLQPGPIDSRQAAEIERAVEKEIPVLLAGAGGDFETLPEYVRAALSSEPRLPLSQLPNDRELESLSGYVKVALASRSNRPVVTNDPQKGQWGGKPAKKGRILTASVTEVDEEWFSVILELKSTAAEPLDSEVEFHLHPSFEPGVRTVEPQDGVARLELRGWGAFTVGAVADWGKTILELDLSEDPSYPAAFRER